MGLRNSFADSGTPPLDFGAVTLSLDQLSLLGAGSGGKPPARLGCRRLGLLSSEGPLFRDLCQEALSGYPPVHTLAAGVGDGDREAARDMGKRHGRGNLVHMLASGTRGSGEAFRELFVAELNGFHGIYSAVS